MPVEYTNCNGERYYLHEGITKKGDPRYYFSKGIKSKLCERIPDGYEVYEEPNGRPYLRKILIPLISEIEIRIIKNSIPKEVNYKLVVKRRSVTIYTAEELTELYKLFGVRSFGPYQGMMRFILVNDQDRTFQAERYCFRGSIDDWIRLATSRDLRGLARKCCVHLGKDSFFEIPHLVPGF